MSTRVSYVWFYGERKIYKGRFKTITQKGPINHKTCSHWFSKYSLAKLFCVLLLRPCTVRVPIKLLFLLPFMTLTHSFLALRFLFTFDCIPRQDLLPIIPPPTYTPCLFSSWAEILFIVFSTVLFLRRSWTTT